MLPATATQIPEHTGKQINHEIRTADTKIRLLCNRGSNSKAFGRAVKSMGFAWLVTVILPAAIVLSKDWLIRPAWWVIFLLWLTIVARS